MDYFRGEGLLLRLALMQVQAVIRIASIDASVPIMSFPRRGTLVDTIPGGGRFESSAPGAFKGKPPLLKPGQFGAYSKLGLRMVATMGLVVRRCPS